MWKRKNCGTYPKWFARICRKIVKFVLRKHVDIILRGRGKRREVARQMNMYAGQFDQDLPIRFARRVAVYVTIK